MTTTTTAPTELNTHQLRGVQRKDSVLQLQERLMRGGRDLGQRVREFVLLVRLLQEHHCCKVARREVECLRRSARAIAVAVRDTTCTRSDTRQHVLQKNRRTSTSASVDVAARSAWHFVDPRASRLQARQHE